MLTLSVNEEMNENTEKTTTVSHRLFGILLTQCILTGFQLIFDNHPLWNFATPREDKHTILDWFLLAVLGVSFSRYAIRFSLWEIWAARSLINEWNNNYNIQSFTFFLAIWQAAPSCWKMHFMLFKYICSYCGFNLFLWTLISFHNAIHKM